MATMANHDREATQPVCQNCATSTTPLWRRDELGSVLCNACGLFLKLHGRPRPISLKTDVIKSRNRVKTSMRPDLALKKKNAAAAAAAAAAGDPTALANLQDQAYAATAALTARRTLQKGANGHVDGYDTSMSGTATPGLYNTHVAHVASPYPLLDDGNGGAGGAGGGSYQGQHLAEGPSPSGHGGSPANGERPEAQLTPDQLRATNSSLKTRVAELEVINDFIQRQLGLLAQQQGAAAAATAAAAAAAAGDQDAVGQQQQQEQQQQQQQQQTSYEAELRSQIDLLTQANDHLRLQLEESYRRENLMKRRLDELELEHRDARDSLENLRAKRPRLVSPPPTASTATEPALDTMAAAAAAAKPTEAAFASTSSASAPAADNAASAPPEAPESSEANEARGAKIETEEEPLTLARDVNGHSGDDAPAPETNGDFKTEGLAAAVEVAKIALTAVSKDAEAQQALKPETA